jgi:hypothetical protein
MWPKSRVRDWTENRDLRYIETIANVTPTRKKQLFRTGCLFLLAGGLATVLRIWWPKPILTQIVFYSPNTDAVPPPRAVPEPGTLFLTGGVLLLLWIMRRSHLHAFERLLHSFSEVVRAARSPLSSARAAFILLGFGALIFVFGLIAVSWLDHAFDTTPPSVLSTFPPTSRPPSHLMSVSIPAKLKRLSPGDSVPFECNLAFTDLLVQASQSLNNSIRLALDGTHQYAAVVDFKAVGLDAMPYGSAGDRLKNWRAGDVLTWRWILSPKEGRQGTRQFASVDVYIHDINERKVVWAEPVVTMNLEIGTPLGLPSWLISPSFALGTLIAGVLAIVLPWWLNTYGPKRKEPVIQKPDPPKIQL